MDTITCKTISSVEVCSFCLLAWLSFLSHNRNIRSRSMWSNWAVILTWSKEDWINYVLGYFFIKNSFSDFIRSHWSWWGLSWGNIFLRILSINLFDWNWLDIGIVIIGSQLNSNCINIKSKTLCKMVHTIVSSSFSFVFFNDTIILIVLLVSHFFQAICEPSLRVSSKFISVLCFQDLSWKTHWWINLRVVFFNFFLELFILLFSIPVPFVNLL